MELVIGLEGEFKDMTAIGQRFARWVDRMVVSPAGLLHMCVCEGASPILARLVGTYAERLMTDGAEEARTVMEKVGRAWADDDGTGGE